MSAIPEVTKTGPRTYAVVEVVIGGQLVEGRPTTNGVNGIGVAGAGSVKCLGVALLDTIPDAAVVTEPTVDNFGTANLLVATQNTRCSVANAPAEVPVKYSANAAFGDRLVVTAAGTVAPAGANPDARTIVAICAQPGGVLSGAKGLTRLV